MQRLIVKPTFAMIALLAVSCGQSNQAARDSELAGVPQIVDMKPAGEGRFEIKCEDGHTETVTSEQMAAGQVCLPPLKVEGEFFIGECFKGKIGQWEGPMRAAVTFDKKFYMHFAYRGFAQNDVECKGKSTAIDSAEVTYYSYFAEPVDPNTGVGKLSLRNRDNQEIHAVYTLKPDGEKALKLEITMGAFEVKAPSKPFSFPVPTLFTSFEKPTAMGPTSLESKVLHWSLIGEDPRPFKAQPALL